MFSDDYLNGLQVCVCVCLCVYVCVCECCAAGGSATCFQMTT